MKKIFLVATLFIITIPIFSQDKKDLKKAFVNVGVQTSLGLADLADTHGFGVGANVQGGYRVTDKVSLTARLSYTRLFGKKFSHDFYEPGGGGSYHGRHEGMNDFGVTGGGRINFNENWFGGLEGGICIDSGGGHSETGGLGMGEIGYGFHCGNKSPLEQAISFFFGVCGDPKVQIGLRYSIRL